ncbi:hypothetical protein TNCV_5125251 [Trichonephila clavipes]|nr:hypothetical protein TNCV_5125251 [Trichonephila clavipes]
MFQARRLLQQQFPTEPSIPQQELLLQQLIMSPRRDVVGSIGEIKIRYVKYRMQFLRYPVQEDIGAHSIQEGHGHELVVGVAMFKSCVGSSSGTTEDPP